MEIKMTTRKFKIKINGKQFEAEVEEIGTSSPPATLTGLGSPVPVVNQPVVVSGNTINAPMPGKIISVKVSKGQLVQAGDVVLILEAMKMEQEIKNPSVGTVADILVNAGDIVKKEQVLIIIC